MFPNAVTSQLMVILTRLSLSLFQCCFLLMSHARPIGKAILVRGLRRRFVERQLI